MSQTCNRHPEPTPRQIPPGFDVAPLSGTDRPHCCPTGSETAPPTVLARTHQRTNGSEAAMPSVIARPHQRTTGPPFVVVRPDHQRSPTGSDVARLHRHHSPTGPEATRHHRRPSPTGSDTGLPHRRPTVADGSQAPTVADHHVIYFEGYPVGWRVTDLQKLFLQHDIHGLVSLAWKKNARNLPFGFIRLHQDLSLLSVIAKINRITIGSRRLRAFQARHPEKPSPPQEVHRAHFSTKQKPAFKPSMRDNRSYASVTASSSTDPVVKELHFTGTLSAPDWFSTSCVVTLRDIRTLIHFPALLKDRNFAFRQVSALGGDRLIVTFFSKDALDGFMKGDKAFLNDLIKEAAYMDSSVSPTERLAWIDFFGIPPVHMTSAFVEFIAGTYGKVVGIHEDFTLMRRLDIISVLVSIVGRRVDEQIKVQVGDSALLIHAMESNSPLSFGNSMEIETDDESNSQDTSVFVEPKQPSTEFAEQALSTTSKVSVNLNEAVQVTEVLLPSDEDNMVLGRRPRTRSILPQGLLGLDVESVSNETSIDIGNMNFLYKAHHPPATTPQASEVDETWRLGLQMGLFSEKDKITICNGLQGNMTTA